MALFGLAVRRAPIASRFAVERESEAIVTAAVAQQAQEMGRPCLLAWPALTTG